MNQNFNYNQNSNKKNIFIIICIIAIICVSVFVYFKFIKTDNNKTIESVEENTPSNIDTSSSNVNTDNEDTENSDTNISYDENGAFLMEIEDIFTVAGTGTVVTGKIERGSINTNDTVQIIGLNDEIKSTVVTNIQTLRQDLDIAKAGESVGIVLKDIERDEVKVGQVLAKPDSIKNVTKFVAQVYVLKPEEGGGNRPFFNGDIPEFYFRTAGIRGTVKLPTDTKMVNPGDTINMTIELVSPVAIEVGTKLRIQENRIIVAEGMVTNIY